ncbi:hypothetical protein [Tengunoibacter tsumagoiensis]|uniref:Uncharacterized protein n=1 Tax=Tengunoibacter tsumagoiensis TaxID=2014871 RepID=A0A401ZX66_9CHLR|nr:hypothetical protein [Tengunoibacter tsumagoiensis]GCE11435.1 hypothetical protein KTT_12940 [Tengunoibacter tsumagoiensis]
MWPFDQFKQHIYRQYAQAYDTGDYSACDPNEAMGHLQQFMQGAPVDLQHRVYQQHFEQMPYEHRAILAQQMPPQYAMDPNDPSSMSQSFARMGREQPQLLQRLFSHPILLGSGIALTALVAKHVLAHHYQHGDGQSYPQSQYAQEQPIYNQAGYNQGYQQDNELRRELANERRQEQELRRELREEREWEREERPRHHHREEF